MTKKVIFSKYLVKIVDELKSYISIFYIMICDTNKQAFVMKNESMSIDVVILNQFLICNMNS